MERPLPIEESYHADKRRRQGIARLAIYTAFERAMREADDGAITRDEAIDKARTASSAIRSHMNVAEVV